MAGAAAWLVEVPLWRAVLVLATAQLLFTPPTPSLASYTSNSTNNIGELQASSPQDVQAESSRWDSQKHSASRDWKEIMRRVQEVDLQADRNTVLSDVKAILARQLPFWGSIELDVIENAPSALQIRDNDSTKGRVTRPRNNKKQAAENETVNKPVKDEQIALYNNIRRTLDVSEESKSLHGEEMFNTPREQGTNQSDRSSEETAFQHQKSAAHQYGNSQDDDNSHDNGAHQYGNSQDDDNSHDNGAHQYGNSQDDDNSHDKGAHQYVHNQGILENSTVNVNKNISSAKEPKLAIALSKRVFRYSTTVAPPTPTKINTIDTNQDNRGKIQENKTPFDSFIPSVRWPPEDKKVTTKKPVRLNLVSFNRKPEDENSSLESSKRVAILHIPENRRAFETQDASVDQNAQGSSMSPTSIHPQSENSRSGHSKMLGATDDEGSMEVLLASTKRQQLPKAVTPFLIIPQTGKTIPLPNLSSPEVSRILAAERRQDINPLNLLVRPFRNMLGLRNPQPQKNHQFLGQVQNRAVQFNSVSLNNLPPGNFIIEFGPPKGDDIVTSISPELRAKTSSALAQQGIKATAKLPKAPTILEGVSNTNAGPQKAQFFRQSNIRPQNFPRQPTFFDSSSQSTGGWPTASRPLFQSGFNFRAGKLQTATRSATPGSSDALWPLQFPFTKPFTDSATSSSTLLQHSTGIKAPSKAKAALKEGNAPSLKAGQQRPAVQQTTEGQLPAGGQQYPTGGLQYPTGGLQYLTGGQRNPTGGLQYPTVGQQYSTGGQQQPTGGQQQPTGEQQQPTGGQQQPTGGQQQPTVGQQQQPTGGQQQPTGGQQQPTGGQQQPTGGQQYPTGGQQQPTGGQEQPTGGLQYPTGGQQFPTIGFGHPQLGSILPPDKRLKTNQELDPTLGTPAEAIATKVATPTKRLPPLLAGRYQYPSGTSKPGRLPWPNTGLVHSAIEHKKGKEIGSSYTEYSLPTTTRRPTGFSLPDLSIFNPFRFLFSSRDSRGSQTTASGTPNANQQSESFNIIDWFTGQSRSDVKVDDVGAALPFAAGLSFPSPFLGVSAQIRNKSPPQKEARYKLPMTVPGTNSGNGDHYNDKYKMPQTVPGVNTGNGDHYNDRYMVRNTQAGVNEGTEKLYKDMTQSDMVFKTNDRTSPLYYVVNPEAMGNNNNNAQPVSNGILNVIGPNQPSQIKKPEVSSYSSIKRNLRRGKQHLDGVPELDRQVYATKTIDGKIKLPTSFFNERLQQLRAHFSQEDLQSPHEQSSLKRTAAHMPGKALSYDLPELQREESLFKTAEDLAQYNTLRPDASSTEQTLDSWPAADVTWGPPPTSPILHSSDVSPIIEVAPQAITKDMWSHKMNQNLTMSFFARRMGEGDSVYVEDMIDEQREDDDEAPESEVDVQVTATESNLNSADHFAHSPGNDDEYYFGLKKTINHIPISKAIHHISGARKTNQGNSLPHKTTAIIGNRSTTHNNTASNTTGNELFNLNKDINVTPGNKRMLKATKKPETNQAIVTKQYKVDAGPQSVNFTRVKWGFWQAADMDNRPAAIELQKVARPTFQLRSTHSEPLDDDPMSAEASSHNLVIVKAIPMNEQGVALTNYFQPRQQRNRGNDNFENSVPKEASGNDKQRHTQEDREILTDSNAKIESINPTHETTISDPTTTTPVANSVMKVTSTTTPRSPRPRSRNVLFIPGFHDRKKERANGMNSTTTRNTARPRRTFPRSYYTTQPRPVLNVTEWPSTDTFGSKATSSSRQLVPHIDVKFLKKYTRDHQSQDSHEQKTENGEASSNPQPFSKEHHNETEETFDNNDGEKDEHVDKEEEEGEKYEVAESQRVNAQEQLNAMNLSQGKKYTRKRKPTTHRPMNRSSSSANTSVTPKILTEKLQELTKAPMVSELAGFLNNTAQLDKAEDIDQRSTSTPTSYAKAIESSVQKFYPLTVQPEVDTQKLTKPYTSPSRIKIRARPRENGNDPIFAASGVLTNSEISPQPTRKTSIKTEATHPTTPSSASETPQKSKTFFDRIRNRLASYRSKSKSPHERDPDESGSPRSIRGGWVTKMTTAARAFHPQLVTTTPQPQSTTPAQPPPEVGRDARPQTKVPLKSIANHFNAVRRRNKQLLNLRRKKAHKNERKLTDSVQREVTTTNPSDWPTNIKTLGLKPDQSATGQQLQDKMNLLTTASISRAPQSSADQLHMSMRQLLEQPQQIGNQDTPMKLSSSNHHQFHDYETPQYHRWESVKL